MLRYVVNRLAWALVVLWAVATVTFVLMHSTPGSPWDAFCKPGGWSGQTPGEPCVQALEGRFNHHHGLSRPLSIQYLIYLKNAAHLNLGQSFQYQGSSVVELIARGFVYSGVIGLGAFLLSIGIGVPLGIIAALRQNTWIDYGCRLLTTVGYSVPSFVLVIFLLVIFAVKLAWLPIVWSGWQSYILPTVALAVGILAYITRMTRASVLDVLSQEYVRAARAKGLKRSTVNLRHVIRNALLPVVTILGPALAAMITGSIIVETVLGVPGIGSTFIESINARDYPVIMGIAIFYGFLITCCNLLVDIVYSLLDPRIGTVR